MDHKRVPLFLFLTFVLSWGLLFYMWSIGGLENPASFYMAAGMMLIPALCVILTRLFTGEGFKDLWLLPQNFKHTWGVYVLAWLLPSLLILLGGALWFLLNPDRFDPAMSAGVELLRSQADATGQVVTNQQLRSAIILNSLSAILIAPLVNVIFCMGEELGWRGYLLPKLAMKYKPAAAALMVGIIWGVWHAPIIAMGHNYGLGYAGWPWLGISAMILFCIVLGYLFGWMALRAKSALPAALAHGALNGVVSLPTMFLIGQSNPFIGPLATGVIGGSGFIVAGIICWWLLNKNPDQYHPAHTDVYQPFRPIFVTPHEE
ncbi:MAG: CPBP family intramembrane metalloprotease [Syntrophomonadaceae bacterium]|nr:CPBP family intramembrane metalloprotease [Syntrophomonadaceae bacterium]